MKKSPYDLHGAIKRRTEHTSNKIGRMSQVCGKVRLKKVSSIARSLEAARGLSLFKARW
jgi:hypothetical protein